MAAPPSLNYAFAFRVVPFRKFFPKTCCPGPGRMSTDDACHIERLPATPVGIVLVRPQGRIISLGPARAREFTLPFSELAVGADSDSARHSGHKGFPFSLLYRLYGAEALAAADFCRCLLWSEMISVS